MKIDPASNSIPSALHQLNRAESFKKKSISPDTTSFQLIPESRNASFSKLNSNESKSNLNMEPKTQEPKTLHRRMSLKSATMVALPSVEHIEGAEAPPARSLSQRGPGLVRRHSRSDSKSFLQQAISNNTQNHSAGELVRQNSTTSARGFSIRKEQEDSAAWIASAEASHTSGESSANAIADATIPNAVQVTAEKPSFLTKLMSRQWSTTFSNASGSDVSQEEAHANRSTSRLMAQFFKKTSDAQELQRKKIKTWNDFAAIYKMGAILGQGTQGKVVVGERIEDGLAVAIKIVDERTIKPWSYVNKIPVSVHLLSNLNSAESEDEDPLFLRYIDHFYIEKHWVIITEYQGKEWVDLHDYLNNSNKSLSEQECLFIFTQIVQALSHLYAMGFTHNDIKENNVLIHRKTKEIKLIDLCSCRELTDELISPIEFKGTMWYASPEVKTCNFFSTEKQDIYALGILLLMMIFKDSFPIDLQKDLLDPHELPKAFKSLEFSSTTIRLIQSMVQRKAHKRPNIIDVLDLMSTWKQ